MQGSFLGHPHPSPLTSPAIQRGCTENQPSPNPRARSVGEEQPKSDFLPGFKHHQPHLPGKYLSLGARSLLPMRVLPGSSPPRPLWDRSCCSYLPAGDTQRRWEAADRLQRALQAPLGTKFTRQHTNTELGPCCWPCCCPLPSWKGPRHAGTFAQHPPEDKGKGERQGTELG